MAAALALQAVAAFAQTDAERVRAAKALTLDRKYVEARAAWTEILAKARGPAADEAAYWIARSSENLEGVRASPYAIPTTSPSSSSTTSTTASGLSSACW